MERLSLFPELIHGTRGYMLHQAALSGALVTQDLGEGVSHGWAGSLNDKQLPFLAQ